MLKNYYLFCLLAVFTIILEMQVKMKATKFYLLILGMNPSQGYLLNIVYSQIKRATRALFSISESWNLKARLRLAKRLLTLGPFYGAELASLQGLEHAQHFIYTAAHIVVVIERITQNAVRINNECAAQGYAFFFQ